MDLFLLVMMMMVTGMLSQSVRLCVTGEVADNLPVVLFSRCMQKRGMLFRLWNDYVTTPHLASDVRLGRNSAGC